jgi:hypothetical protein
LYIDGPDLYAQSPNIYQNQRIAAHRQNIAPTMIGCLEPVNATIANTLDTWGAVDRSALEDFKINSCFRPDTGAALLPWVYALIAIITHLPVLFIRVT